MTQITVFHFKHTWEFAVKINQMVEKEPAKYAELYYSFPALNLPAPNTEPWEEIKSYGQDFILSTDQLVKLTALYELELTLSKAIQYREEA